MTASTEQSALPLFGVPRFSLALVREDETTYDNEALDTPGAAAKFIRQQFRLDTAPAEKMIAVYLDTQQRAIGGALLFQGTINRAACEPRAILQAGLLMNAAGFILAHNHPSGEATPSAEDLAFTRRIAEAGDIVGVRLIDHLIIGADKHESLRRRGAW